MTQPREAACLPRQLPVTPTAGGKEGAGETGGVWIFLPVCVRVSEALELELQTDGPTRLKEPKLLQAKCKFQPKQPVPLAL